ncbi:hypothetical protein [Dyella acidiphila]|uniref:LexA-binding, inner membrane-associated hydrolase n=1 Tax=Dyella acidiphila TaxID=2775866 RepID=A0ABR9G4E3_9GAMM|nr:hypothetical protein [Dyella acidiphila]MBE1158878.1 hypothetical protein [Dyella acidiphila]
MYMGHYAIALGARRWLRPLPMAWLLFASIEPDLHDVLGDLIPALSIGPDTHTVAGAIGAAIVVALLAAVLFRQAALAVGSGLLVLSHVAVDYLTSRLPLWRHGPVVGLHLYAVPWADFVLEALAIAIGVSIYATSPDLRRPARAGLLGMALLMLCMQAVWNFGFGSH